MLMRRENVEERRWDIDFLHENPGPRQHKVMELLGAAIGSWSDFLLGPWISLTFHKILWESRKWPLLRGNRRALGFLDWKLYFPRKEEGRIKSRPKLTREILGGRETISRASLSLIGFPFWQKQFLRPPKPLLFSFFFFFFRCLFSPLLRDNYRD